MGRAWGVADLTSRRPLRNLSNIDVCHDFFRPMIPQDGDQIEDFKYTRYFRSKN